jgi:hypothetical protein
MGFPAAQIMNIYYDEELSAIFRKAEKVGFTKLSAFSNQGKTVQGSVLVRCHY